MNRPIQKGPWKVLGSEVKYRNPWISVREDSVIRPDGKSGIFGVVTMQPGVSVLPLDSEGNVYLVKEYRYGVERDTVEVVSGGFTAGENQLDAVRRELEEETGIHAKKITELGFVDPFTSVVACVNYVYLAQELEFGEAHPEGTEQLEILKVTFGQALQWVLDSKITHGASVALILKANLYLSGNGSL